jgi:hypothetical protein
MKVSLVPNMEMYLADAELRIDRFFIGELNSKLFYQTVYDKKVAEAKAFVETGDIGPLMNAEFVATEKRPEEIAAGILAKHETHVAWVSEIEQKRLAAKQAIRSCKSQFEIRAVLQPLGVPEN